MTSGVAAATAAAVSSNFVRFSATSTMDLKSHASRTAVERPIPRLAPVTTATEFVIRYLL